MLAVNNKNIKRRQRHLSGVFNANFEHNLHLFLMFLLLLLTGKYVLAMTYFPTSLYAHPRLF